MIYAEDVNYWKTGKSAPGIWLDKTAAQIEKLGGRVLIKAEGLHPETGREAYMLGLEIEGENYKVVWPVLPCYTQTQANERAAKVQAATMLYHDVKARCVSAVVLGARQAFFSYYMLPDGRSVSSVSTPELSEAVNQFFPPSLGTGQI